MGSTTEARMDEIIITLGLRDVPRADGNGYFVMKSYHFDRVDKHCLNMNNHSSHSSHSRGQNFPSEPPFFNKVIGSTVVNCGCSDENISVQKTAQQEGEEENDESPF